MSSKLLCLLAIALTSFQVQAGPEEWLAAFARSNSGKFSSEITNLPKLITVRSRPFSNWWQNSEFDQDRKLLTIKVSESVWSEWIYERCRSAGTFLGTTGLGIKISIKKLKCERLEIQDHSLEGVRLGDLEIPMNPQQYRDFKALGPLYEIEFLVGKGTKQEIASDDVIIDEAKASKPIERHIRILRVNGEMAAIRILSPDGKTVFAQFAR